MAGIARVREHATVVGSDSGQIGTADHLGNGETKLTKGDTDAGGPHHLRPARRRAGGGGRSGPSRQAGRRGEAGAERVRGEEGKQSSRVFPKPLRGMLQPLRPVIA
ncbi:DUF2171 domain-containing protein [Methylobacterium nigriterrae]|uniref:DUF2171 domain-containing protein n=1 Tax=Methylobacterium nigriterrae TaxID=3127512 RepID=UPI003D668FF4